MTNTVRAALDRYQSEEEFQRAITDTATLLGLPWFHDNDSRQNNPGLPDLLIADWRHATVYAWELKTMTGARRKDQDRWLEAMARCTRFASGLYRPSDWETVLRLLEHGP